MERPEEVIHSLESYLGSYVDWRLVDENIISVSKNKKKELMKVVNNFRKFQRLTSALSSCGLNLIKMDYNPDSKLFTLETDMDYIIARRIVKQNELENIFVEQFVTKDNFCTYINFEAIYHPDVIFLVGEYIDRFRKK